MVSSNGSDTPSDLDISVVRTAIDMGHRMIDQIINGVHYGSEEVRNLLYEETDYILECKVCRNLFRSFPNLVAHKRIYCQETFDEKTEREKAVPVSIEEETVIVEPDAPEELSQAASTVRDAQKSLTQEVRSNQFDGKSAEYQFYTKIAENLELRKSAKETNSVIMTAIPSNPHAMVITHAKGDHSAKSTPKGSPKKSDPLKTDKSVSVNVDSSSSHSKSIANICMKLASKPSVELNTVPVIAHDTKSALSKRSRKSLPRKSVTEDDPDYSPYTTAKKVKKSLFIKKDRSQDMDVNVSVASAVPQMKAGKDLNEEWMKHCDLNTKTCKECGIQSGTLPGLKIHMIGAHGIRVGNRKCPKCDKYYVTEKNVRRHLKSYHFFSPAEIIRYKVMRKKEQAREKLNKSDGSIATKLKPNPDDKKTASSTGVNKTLAETAPSTGVDKTFSSGILQKSVAQKSDWRKHSDLSRNICKVCKLQFGNISGLKLHLKQHGFLIGEFRCVRCSQCFASFGTLKRHNRRVHHKKVDKMTRNIYITMCKQRQGGKVKTESTKSGNKGSILYSTLTVPLDDQDSNIFVEKEENEGLMVLQDHDQESDTTVRKASKETVKKNPAKLVTKETAKLVTKEPAKSVTKETAKSVTKETAKSATKETVKSVTKDSAKSVTKEPANSVTMEPAKSVTKETAKSVIKNSAKSVTKEQDKSVTKDSPKSAAKEPTKSVTKEPSKTVTKETAKSVTKELNKYVTKVLALSVTKGSAKSITKEPAKSVSKETAKSVTKEKAQSVTKEPDRYVTKEPAKSVTKQPAKPITREQGTSTYIHFKKLGTRTQKENTSLALEKEPSVSNKIPTVESQNDNNPQKAEKPANKPQKENGSTSVSKTFMLTQREQKQSSSNSKGTIPVRLSRPMKRTKQTLMPGQKLHRTQTRIKPMLGNKTVAGKVDIGRLERELKKLENTAGFVESTALGNKTVAGKVDIVKLEREMKKLENSAGFVESNVYNSSGSGLSGKKRQGLDE